MHAQNHHSKVYAGAGPVLPCMHVQNHHSKVYAGAGPVLPCMHALGMSRDTTRILYVEQLVRLYGTDWGVVNGSPKSGSVKALHSDTLFLIGIDEYLHHFISWHLHCYI